MKTKNLKRQPEPSSGGSLKPVGSVRLPYLTFMGVRWDVRRLPHTLAQLRQRMDKAEKLGVRPHGEWYPPNEQHQRPEPAAAEQ